jgi:cell division septum initiation protein DivIVA
LDRQSIEKKDFPVGRRGYEPEAVDSHLSALADEIAEFKRSARRRSDTLASSASEQVRAIIEAAESSAADILRAAENEAREVRDEANSEVGATREQAADQAREYVGKVSQSTSSMLERLDAMESELGTLLESLRTGANRLAADLQLLEGNLAEVGELTTSRSEFELEPVLEPEPEDASEDDTVRLALGGDGEALEGDGEAALLDGIAGSDDAEGARLIALNMALNGTPREETDRYLSENFQLSDRVGLLDEVYASVDA